MKDLLVIGGMSLGAIVIGLGLFFYGTGGTFHAVENNLAPSSITSDATASVAVASVLAQGAYAPVDTRVNYLIKNKKELQKLWGIVYGSDTYSPTLPKVDFSKYQVLAVFAGTKPTGGYAISVSKVQDSTQKRIVTIIMMSPAASCSVAKAHSTPYEILTVPSTTLPLTHKDMKITRACN